MFIILKRSYPNLEPELHLNKKNAWDLDLDRAYIKGNNSQHLDTSVIYEGADARTKFYSRLALSVTHDVQRICMYVGSRV